MTRWVAPLCLLALCATGCATTGLAWVHERESGVDLSPPDPPSEGAPSARVSPPLVDEPVAERAAPRPRLDRTITLGGSAESSAPPYDAAVATGDPRPTTVVNVYVNQMPGVAYGASYGYGYASPLFVAPPVTAVRTQAAALRPGLDWPAVANHGPAFPYRMGPASPWDGASPRRR
jgi:hypothetical protein